MRDEDAKLFRPCSVCPTTYKITFAGFTSDVKFFFLKGFQKEHQSRMANAHKQECPTSCQRAGVRRNEWGSEFQIAWGAEPTRRRHKSSHSMALSSQSDPLGVRTNQKGTTYNIQNMRAHCVYVHCRVCLRLSRHLLSTPLVHENVLK